MSNVWSLKFFNVKEKQYCSGQHYTRTASLSAENA